MIRFAFFMNALFIFFPLYTMDSQDIERGVSTPPPVPSVHGILTPDKAQHICQNIINVYLPIEDSKIHQQIMPRVERKMIDLNRESNYLGTSAILEILRISDEIANNGSDTSGSSDDRWLTPTMKRILAEALHEELEHKDNEIAIVRQKEKTARRQMVLAACSNVITALCTVFITSAIALIPVYLSKC